MSGNAQNYFDDLKPIDTLRVNLNEDNDLDNFLLTSKLQENFNQYSYNFINIQKVILENHDIKLFAIPIVENTTVNYIIGVFNSSNNDYLIFFEKFERSENSVFTIVYDKNLNEIYSNTYDLSNSKLIYQINNNYESVDNCFVDCMHRQEAFFELTFEGWIYWNVIPATQVIAAINCQGCCKRWWRNKGC